MICSCSSRSPPLPHLPRIWARRRNTIARDNWERGACFWIMAREHPPCSRPMWTKTLSRRLARAQSASETVGQCVTACESFTGVPGPTSSWREGTSATDLTDKDIGTAIATFQGSGDKARYKSDAGGHKNSGVYMGRSVGGFWMADQWPGQKPVTIRFVPTTDHNNPDNASMNGSSYSVILVPNP